MQRRDGYSLSKYISEALVHSACRGNGGKDSPSPNPETQAPTAEKKDRALPCTFPPTPPTHPGEVGDGALPYRVYRPGYIGPHSESGCYNPSDTLTLLLWSFLCDGIYPQTPPEARLSIVPVDVVSQTIAALSQEPFPSENAEAAETTNAEAAKTTVVHLVHPRGSTPWSQILAPLQELSSPPTPRPHREWWQQTMRQATDNKKTGSLHPLAPLAHSFQDGFPQEHHDLTDTAYDPQRPLPQQTCPPPSITLTFVATSKASNKLNGKEGSKAFCGLFESPCSQTNAPRGYCPW